MVMGLNVPAWADDEQVFFCGRRDVPKDKTRISAKVLQDGASSDIKTHSERETVVANPVWRARWKSVMRSRSEGMKIGDGIEGDVSPGAGCQHVADGTARFAGDCLIKKSGRDRAAGQSDKSNVSRNM